MQCPIYLSKYYSQVENLAGLVSFSTEEKVADSSNQFSSTWQTPNTVRKNVFTLEYEKQLNEMNRHEASLKQQQVNVVFFSPLSKQKDDVQEKQNHNAKQCLRKLYLPDAVASTKDDLL